MEPQTGLKAEFEIIVSPKDTASQYGSGSLEVFASPALVALMEKTAMIAIENHLQQGQSSVGTEISIKHIKATSVGEAVLCLAELVEIDGNRLNFKVEAFDSQGMIALGHHQRFLIDEKRFMEKLNR